jgi:hypothetical protein
MSDFGVLVQDFDRRREANEFLMKGLAEAIKDHMREHLAPLHRKIEELETAQREFGYCGTWSAGDYKRGNFVTHGGSVWHCNANTSGKPGEDLVCWTLAVKRGRDGKDANGAVAADPPARRFATKGGPR